MARRHTHLPLDKRQGMLYISQKMAKRGGRGMAAGRKGEGSPLSRDIRALGNQLGHHHPGTGRHGRL